MPKPKYILCAESSSLDSATNLISFFHVLEGYTLSQSESVESGSVLPFPLKFKGVAVWERTDDDSEDRELDFELTVAFPGEEPETIRSGTFYMTRRFQRFMATIVAPGLPAGESGKPKSGDIVFQSRVKPSGDSEWLSQEYTIPVDVIGDESEAPNKAK